MKINHILLKYDRADIEFIVKMKVKMRRLGKLRKLPWEIFFMNLARRVQ